MGSFISFLTPWQGQAARDVLALSLPKIKYTYPAHGFHVVQGLFSAPNVTTALWVFLKPTVPRTKMEVALIFIITAAFWECNSNIQRHAFPVHLKKIFFPRTISSKRQGHRQNMYKCVCVHLYSIVASEMIKKSTATHFNSFHLVAYLLWAEFAAACITAAAASCALRFTDGMGGPIPGPPCWDMPGELGVILLMFPGNGLLCIPADGIRPRGMVLQGWLGPCPCIWLLAFIPMPGPGPL